MSKGKRYNAETLEVKYRGKNISGCWIDGGGGPLLLENIPKIRRRLEVLYDVASGILRSAISPRCRRGEAERSSSPP